MTSGGVAAAATPLALARRLRPLQLAVGLQGMALWVQVEKLFMSQIGFDGCPSSVARPTTWHPRRHNQWRYATARLSGAAT